MGFEEARASLVNGLKGVIRDKRVLEAMARIPRELFIPTKLQDQAYEDKPLPIGFGQTISQPYIIALMTQALDLNGNEKVLEIGTGSGYQSAILAELAQTVVTTERVPELAQTAQELLNRLGYNNVEVHLAEETIGWQSDAPYDAIIVTAGAPSIPTDLMLQLAYNGRLVIPVGSRYILELYKITKRRGKNLVHNLGGCRFVSLIGKDAWEE